MPDNILKGINAIIFDLGGVILNIDYALTINAFKRLGVENFDALYNQASQEGVFDLYETGKITSDEFVDHLQQYLPRDVTTEEIVEAWNAMLLDLPMNRLLLLKKLSQAYKLFLFSNTNAIHYTSFTSNLLKTHGDENLIEKHFVKCYFSHLVKKRKPNPDAFQHILNEHALSPSTTLFVDDSVQHIEGAKFLGINTYHLEGENIIDIFDSEIQTN